LLGIVACEASTEPFDPNPVLVVSIQRDGNRDIWRLRLDGSDTLRLTTHQADDVRPTVARSLVVFASYRDGNGELYSVHVNGGDQRRLTSSSFNEGDPALSFDASRLAFTSDSTGAHRLYLARPDATSAKWLTEGHGIPGTFESAPAWNPSLRQLAFTSLATGQPAIESVDISSGTTSPIVSTHPPNVEPDWSPSGKLLVFVSNRDGDAELYLHDAPSGSVRRLTRRPGTDRRPRFLSEDRVAWIADIGGIPRLVWATIDNPDAFTVVSLPSGTVEWVSVRR
jgi:Tol biopolymer transport system component